MCCEYYDYNTSHHIISTVKFFRSFIRNLLHSCSRLESNQGPSDLQPDALPTELQEPTHHKPFLLVRVLPKFSYRVTWVTKYESNTLILSMSIFVYSRYTRNIRKETKNMSLDIILQLLDSLPYLLDFPMFGGEKKNRKTKHITQNPHNRQQRRAQNKRNHHTNITGTGQIIKSSRFFK